MLRKMRLQSLVYASLNLLYITESYGGEQLNCFEAENISRLHYVFCESFI